MNADKIHALAVRYANLFPDVEPKRIDPEKTFGDYLGDCEALQAHVRYLAYGLQEFCLKPEKFGKANRHLTAIQMTLSFLGVYTLKELMEHNFPLSD